jgi:outer membrane protein assembly factor BamB
MPARRTAVTIALLAIAAAAPPTLAATQQTPLACSAGAAPGGDWGAYGHDAYNTRTQTSEHLISAANVPKIKPAWTFNTSKSTGGADNGGFEGTPLELNGCVFAASAGGFVYALNTTTGTVQWRHRFTVPTRGAGGIFVGGPAQYGGRIIVLVNKASGPYLAALDQHTGRVLWTSKPIYSYPGGYTNATPQVFNGIVIAGFSPPEGDPNGVGGFALLNATSGAIIKTTPTIPASDVKKGYAGGGIWSTPAFDPQTRYAYVGAGNPFSRSVEHRNTNAILKIDLDPARPTFGQIVASYKGNVDQYAKTLAALSQTPACSVGSNRTLPLDDPACGQLDLDFGSAPNLFLNSKGRVLVGDLQKSGVYHVANATTMKPAWTKIVGLSCQVCNAESTAADGKGVYVEGAPGGVMWGLTHDGKAEWASPVGDGAHYEAVSTANGVAFTIDNFGTLGAWNARTGRPLFRRPLTATTHADNVGVTSAGIAIADHTLFVSANAGRASGVIVAYRLG